MRNCDTVNTAVLKTKSDTRRVVVRMRVRQVAFLPTEHQNGDFISPSRNIGTLMRFLH